MQMAAHLLGQWGKRKGSTRPRSGVETNAKGLVRRRFLAKRGRRGGPIVFGGGGRLISISQRGGCARGRQQSPEGVGSGVERGRAKALFAEGGDACFVTARRGSIVTPSPERAPLIVGNDRRPSRERAGTCPAAVRPFFRIFFCPDVLGGPRTLSYGPGTRCPRPPANKRGGLALGAQRSAVSVTAGERTM